MLLFSSEETKEKDKDREEEKEGGCAIARHSIIGTIMIGSPSYVRIGQ